MLEEKKRRMKRPADFERAAAPGNLFGFDETTVCPY
jgi:hypothetical protein